MNIFHKVTRRTLAENRTRTIVTIIGILLSAAMFTAVTVSVSSITEYLKKCTIYRGGDWHGCFYDLPEQELQDFLQNEEIADAALAQNIGYAEVETTNTYKPYLFVMGADDLFWKNLPIHMTAGNLPTNSREILIPDHLFYNGGLQYQIGDEITLQLGTRCWEDEVLTQSTPYWEENEEGPAEHLEIEETRSYTVVGFYERPDFENYEAAGYTALTLWDDTRPSQTVAAYFHCVHPQNTFEFVSSASDVYGGGSWNSSLLRYEGASRYSSYQVVLVGMAVILIALIMFGSISLIYNAFSISVSERTRQFGLLSSVGATKKQIRKMVFTEASYVSLIGIPAGILSGIVGMGITFWLVGDKFYAFYGIEEISLTLQVSPFSIVAAVVITYGTVLLSAWIPAVRATKVSAMDAIRQTQDIRIRKKDVKTRKITQKLFGLEGMLANKHFKRNRKRYRATILSLFASIVLFISSSSYCTYLTDMVTNVFEEYDHDIRYDWNVGLTKDNTFSFEEGAQLLGKSEGITQFSYVKEMGDYQEFPSSILTEEARALLNSDEDASATNATLSMYLQICGVDSASFDRYLKENGLRKADYYDAEKPLALLMKQTREFSPETQRYEKMDILKPDVETLTLRLVDEKKQQAYLDSAEFDTDDSETAEKKIEDCQYDLVVQIGSYVETLPFGLNSSSADYMILIYPMEQFDRLIQKQTISESIYFKTENHETALETLQETARENGISEEFFTDLYESSANERDLVTIIKVFSYGFIILISLISLANVFNTISTSVLLRRREFAMLRSVGMTEKGFYRMLSYESLLYGTKSLLFGIPVSFFVTRLIFQSVSAGYDTNFYLPWGAVMIAVLSVFLVVFATMLYAIGKVKKDNLVESLKSETY